MLDVHAPHESVHTWRDFLLHIATIVIGLLIAVGLEQTVEFLHHRQQIAETREALRQEREENHKHFATGVLYWREGVARIQNDLLVLRYLQQHPGTPQEKLPGVPIWNQNGTPAEFAVWDAALQTGVTSMMPREEVAEETHLYKSLHEIGERGGKVWHGINVAEQYTLTDSNPSHLSPSHLAEVIALTESIQTDQYLGGVDLENLSSTFHDFPPSVTFAELDQLRHRPDQQTKTLLAPAHAISDERVKASVKTAEAVSLQAAASGKN
jgi:hypothetical protein